MNYKFLFYFLLSFLFIITSCKKDEEGAELDSINKIMPLGASRVEGARPSFESFRFELWKLMVEGNWDFDFVGTMNDNFDYPNGEDFDRDHEGRGGWTSGQILNGIEGWLEKTGVPDIVLFSSPGGNDALQGLNLEEATENVNTIIDILQEANPNVTIFIEQMAPGHSSQSNPLLELLFQGIHNQIAEIATEQTTGTSSVIAIDMHTGFKDSFLADQIHYNELGAKFIADRYYEELIKVLEEE